MLKRLLGFYLLKFKDFPVIVPHAVTLKDLHSSYCINEWIEAYIEKDYDGFIKCLESHPICYHVFSSAIAAGYLPP